MNDLIYLIARAPSVPGWFVPEMKTECPELPDFHNKLSGLEQEALLKFAHDIKIAEMAVKVETRRLIRDHPRAVRAYREHQEWQAEYWKQCDLQWPLYWATQMTERANNVVQQTPDTDGTDNSLEQLDIDLGPAVGGLETQTKTSDTEGRSDPAD